jgi:AmiR/NasT family two-component response regulator
MSPRILVAEDETLIRLDLERLLDDAGYDVCGVARDGLEVVELARELRPDLVLLDVKMPRLDGVEAAGRILAERHVPIVMLTAYGYGELISRAVDAGVAGFVVKPFEEQALLDALRQARADGPDPAGLAYLDRAADE